jgi:hypothetical protein
MARMIQHAKAPSARRFPGWPGKFDNCPRGGAIELGVESINFNGIVVIYPSKIPTFVLPENLS